MWTLLPQTDPTGLRDCLDGNGNVIHNCPESHGGADGPGSPVVLTDDDDLNQPIGHRTVSHEWHPIRNTPNPANNGQKSYADCVKDSGNYFSLQNGLRSVSGGQLGNGFWSGAILGSPVSDAIEGVQNVYSGNWSGAGGRSGSIVGGWAAGKGADAASQITNISLTTVAATTTTVQAPGASISVTSVNASTMTLPTGLLGQGAKVAAGVLKGLNVWNYGVSAVSGMICAIGR